MKFDNGSSYGPGDMNDYVSAMEPEAYGMKVDNKPDVNWAINDIGMSVPMGIAAQNVAGIYSKLRMGASKLEIQFPGYKSGNRQSQTPEMLGEDQRQAIREMQMANDVRFTTHASFGLMGMLGRDERGNFSVKAATQDLSELKRAIDFQADIGGGGSVVMHSGEFERPMTDMFMDDETHTRNLARDESGRLLVRQAHTEEFDANFTLLDARTSQKFDGVEKDVLVPYPVWNRAKKSGQGLDVEGNSVYINEGDYIDYEGRKIPEELKYDPLKGRVPEFDKETGLFKSEMKHFDYFKREAQELNEFRANEKGSHLDFTEKIYPEEMFQRAKLETQQANARGWGFYFGINAEKEIDQLKKVEKALEFYKKLDAKIPENEKWKLEKQVQTDGLGLIPPDTKNPVELLEEQRKSLIKSLEYARQSSNSQMQQAMDLEEAKINMITPIKRLESHGVRMYAEAGIHALKKTKDGNNPVVVAIENLFPERFGGHLEELKWIIRKSRERMVDMLTQPEIQQGVSRKPLEMDKDKLDDAFSNEKTNMWQENPYYMGISRQEAEELAQKHIRATLDTGHLNMWRKFWQNDPKLSEEENEAKYKEWYLRQIESLAKDDMIGNVHLADNFGYQDDHTAPGQGNAPIKEAAAIIKKHGYDKAITVEPGADATTDNSDFHGLMKTWRLFGSNIYGMGGEGGGVQVPQQWGDVQNSYFGQNKPPYFVFGSYSPSQDWTLWSSVPME